MTGHEPEEKGEVFQNSELWPIVGHLGEGVAWAAHPILGHWANGNYMEFIVEHNLVSIYNNFVTSK